MFSLVRAMFSNHRTLCHNRSTSGLGVEISIVVRSVCVTCCLIAVMGLDLLDLIYNLLMSLRWELELWTGSMWRRAFAPQFRY